MNEIINRYNEYFGSRVQKYGSDIKSVDWGSVDSQKLRFKTLSEIGITEGDAVLDVGCGVGDLFGYLSDKLKSFDYLGVDVVPEMVEHAKIKYPDGNFEYKDITVAKLEKKYDYVVASGILFLGSIDWAEKIIFELFNYSTRGLAINSLSGYATSKDPAEFTPYPEDLLKIAFKLTNRVIMRHDYLPNDFTLYLYKQ